jgi:hypothetical protein
VVANGYLYVLGGSQTYSISPQTNVYYAQITGNGSLSSWTTEATNPLPQALLGQASVYANGYIYVIGGRGSGTGLTTVSYAAPNANGSMGAWSTSSNPLPAKRWVSMGEIANGYIYLMGGYDDDLSDNVNTVYYTSTSRVKLGGSIDLVGLSGKTLADGGGGTLTAGNTQIVGSLEVKGQANLAQGLSVVGNLNGAGKVNFRNTADSTTAYQIQNAAGTNLFAVDTTNSVIKIAGTNSAFAILQLDNAHFKSTQTTAPTIGTPSNCGSGTGPTAAVSSGSTDIAGAFRITAGTTGSPTTCDTTITFNTAYGLAPKSIIVTPQAKDGGTGTAAARQIYVSGSSTTTFIVKFNSNPSNGEENWFYYWIVE